MGTVLLFSQGKKGQVQDPVCMLWVDKVAELSATYKARPITSVPREIRTSSKITQQST
jgi:hypothetical protein